jgi:PTS system mannose-specific IIA component
VIGIVIVAHGELAKEWLYTVEHIVGKQTGVQAIVIESGHDREEKRREICAAANAVDQGDGVVVVTDLFGATPANLCLRACIPEGRRIIFGANMPMLIKLVKCRHMSVPDAVREALADGKRYLDSQIITSEY